STRSHAISTYSKSNHSSNASQSRFSGQNAGSTTQSFSMISNTVSMFSCTQVNVSSGSSNSGIRKELTDSSASVRSTGASSSNEQIQSTNGGRGRTTSTARFTNQMGRPSSRLRL